MIPRDPPVRPDSLRSVLGAAILFALVLLAFASVKSHRDLVAARDHERQLRSAIQETERHNQYLKGHIEQLDHDPATLDRLAREELGLVKPGEVVFIYPPEPAPVAAGTPAAQPAPQPAHPAGH